MSTRLCFLHLSIRSSFIASNVSCNIIPSTRTTLYHNFCFFKYPCLRKFYNAESLNGLLRNDCETTLFGNGVRRDDFSSVEHFRVDDDFKSLFECAVAPHFVFVSDDDIDAGFARASRAPRSMNEKIVVVV